MPTNNRKFKSLILVSLGLALLWLSACRNQEDTTAESRAEAAGTTNPGSTSDNDQRPVILAFGDSLTEGYGLAKAQSYPSLLQKKLDEQGYSYRVVNAGISGDTTSGGLNRVERTLAANSAATLMILELGANDMLRGQDLRNTKNNLAAIIAKAQAQKITVILAGMEAPTNLGEEYQTAFHKVFPDLAQKFKLKLIPFFLTNVAGKPDLNQGDGIHPNVKGTPIVVENVWQVLEPLLKK